jgi:hypothetical protein
MVVVGLAILLEVGSFIVFWVWDGRPFSYARVYEEQKTRAMIRAADTGEDGAAGKDEEEGKQGKKLELAIHPYLGFVRDRDVPLGPLELAKSVNEYGFLDADPPVGSPEDPRIRIAVLGGSMAYIFAFHGEEAFTETLQKAPRFRDREIVLVNLALGGYKQPQQLMALAYVLALDARFDLVVNLDGFNDVALPYHDNLRSGCSPYFPRHWHLLAREMPDFEFLGLAGRLIHLNESLAEWAKAFVEHGAPYSITGQLIWKIRHEALLAEIGRASRAVTGHTPPRLPFAARGPDTSSINEENLYPLLADLWMNASVQLRALCETSGTPYFHFLQPSQYLENSKPMSPAERKTAVYRDLPYRDAILRGYPELRQRAEALRKEGVHFFDMTQIFAEVEEPLYVDNLCHFNKRGCEILAREMASRIKEVLEAEDNR